MADRNAIEHPEVSLGSKTARGMALTMASFGTEKIVRLLALVALARLLDPQEFGLAAMTTLVVNTLVIFKDWGLSSALVYRKDRVQEAAATIMVMEAAIGLGLAAAAFVAAPLAAAYFGEPEVTVLLRVMSLAVLFGSLGTVPHALLQKELDFRRKIVPEVASSVLYAVTAVAMAYLGFGVWSLVGAELAMAGGNLILVWTVTTWRPSFAFDGKLARELIGYGKHIMLFDIVTFVTSNLDYILIGRVLGATPLGLYTMAFRLATYPAVIIPVISRVTFPAFAKLSEDKEKLAEFYLKTLNYASFLTIPAGIGLLIVAPILVPTVFGAKWTTAVPTMRVLIPFAVATILIGNTNELFRGAGRPDIQAKLEVAKLIVLAPSLVYLARFGIFGVGLGQSAVLAVFVPFYLLMASRILDRRPSALVPVLAPTFISTGLMFVLIETAQRVMLSFPDVLSRWVVLVLSVSVGVIAYGGVAFRLNRGTIDELVGALKRGLCLKWT